MITSAVFAALKGDEKIMKFKKWVPTFLSGFAVGLLSAWVGFFIANHIL